MHTSTRVWFGAPRAALLAAALMMPLQAAEAASSRPFRTGFMALNREIDAKKPLAVVENGGWTVNSGVLVGAFDKRWVGGMSMASRRVLWWHDGGADMTAPPGSFGSAVTLGFRDGKIVKLDALTGRQLWAASLDSFSDRPFLLSGSTLFVQTAAQVLYALDFQSGRTLWLFDGGFPDGLTVRGGARPIVHENRVLMGLASGEVAAVRIEDGKLAWRTNPGFIDARFHDVVGEMVVKSNRLLISRYDGFVAALDLTDEARTIVWQQKLPSVATSVFQDGRYYVGGANGDVYGFDANDGRRIFRTVTDAAVMTITASESRIYAAGARGRITALDGRDGSIVWHDQLGSALATPPVIFEKSLYYFTGMKNVYAYCLMPKSELGCGTK